ncbi:hypothetical protein PGH07_04580 [Sulfurovum sp. zt1-1]|uniref:Nitrous oxide reductase accessory protein NosL n=1 Tax=Sulfurovum zhangzhouensis TaxID=3019067 RepID=A0ABT7QX83_9BACT|nr:hypothetical protein [Sulfurovum zhangzhouensis]MDM5271445.1 hypothetical protein [Sulfurovum zhangzhouensis]
MKTFMLNLLTIVIVIAIIIILLLSLGTDQGARYVFKGNTAYEPIVIKPKEYQCSECSMDIEVMEYNAQIITPEGDTYFFDDIGCLVLWLENRTITTQKSITKTLDTGHWIDVDKAWYIRTAPSPMGYGFAAYENKQEGFIPYEEMKLLMLQGKNLHDPFVKKSLLGPS